MDNLEIQYDQALADIRGASNNFTGTNNTFKKITSTVAMNANNDELLDMSSTIGTTGALDVVNGINIALTNNPTVQPNYCYGANISIANNSTQPSEMFGFRTTFTNSAASASGTPKSYGFYSDIQMTGLNGANANVFGGYFKAGGTSTGAGTLNSYGSYIANPTATGFTTRNVYGLYVEAITAGTANYAAYFAGGAVHSVGAISSDAGLSGTTGTFTGLVKTTRPSGNAGYSVHRNAETNGWSWGVLTNGSYGDLFYYNNDAAAVGTKFTLGSDGTVTLGPTYQSAGAVETTAGGVLTTASDERLKRIQGPYEPGLAEILKVKPIRYKWIKDIPEAGIQPEHVYAGFSAQNVRDALGDLAVGQRSDGILSLQDRAILGALVNAVKELSAKNEALEIRLMMLESKKK